MKTKFILIAIIIFIVTATNSLVNGQATETKNIKAYYEFAKSVKLTTLLVVLDNDSTSPINDTIKNGVKETKSLNNQFSKFIKEDNNKKMMYSMINMFKNKFEGLTLVEKHKIWDSLQILLACCIKYKELIGDYD